MWWARYQLLGVLVGVLLLSGCVTETAPDSGTDQDDSALGTIGVGDWVQQATWSGQWEGDLVIRLGVVSPDPVECRWQWGVWGVAHDLRPASGHFVTGPGDRPDTRVGRGAGGLTNVDVHVGVVDVVDEQAFDGPRPWADGRNWTYDLEPDQEAWFAFFATGLVRDEAKPSSADRHFPSASDASNVFMELACQRPVQVVGLGAGETVVVFNESSFGGGASAHAFGGSETTGASVASRVGADVANAHGLMFVKVWGDRLGNHVAAGVIETSYPEGGEVLVDHPTQYIPTCGLALPGCPIAYKHYESGAGPYGVSATYASVDSTGQLQGAIVGYDVVDRLPIDRLA